MTGPVRLVSGGQPEDFAGVMLGVTGYVKKNSKIA